MTNKQRYKLIMHHHVRRCKNDEWVEELYKMYGIGERFNAMVADAVREITNRTIRQLDQMLRDTSQ